MNSIFVVQIKGKTFLFTEEKFIKFCKKTTSRNWSFLFGEVDTNKPLVTSKQITEEMFLEHFNKEAYKNLLKYKYAKIGHTRIIDIPFFTRDIYFKYGERMSWDEQY